MSHGVHAPFSKSYNLDFLPWPHFAKNNDFLNKDGNTVYSLFSLLTWRTNPQKLKLDIRFFHVALVEWNLNLNQRKNIYLVVWCQPLKTTWKESDLQIYSVHVYILNSLKREMELEMWVYLFFFSVFFFNELILNIILKNRMVYFKKRNENFKTLKKLKTLINK